MVIGDKYKLEGDKVQLTLSRKIIRHKGKPEESTDWEAIAYFSTLKGALTYMVDYDLKDQGLEDLKTLMQRQEELFYFIAQVAGGKEIRPVAPPKQTESQTLA